MKDIYVRGIFVEFGSGILSALVGNVPAVDPKIQVEINAPPQLLEIVLRSLGDAT